MGDGVTVTIVVRPKYVVVSSGGVEVWERHCGSKRVHCDHYGAAEIFVVGVGAGVAWERCCGAKRVHRDHCGADDFSWLVRVRVRVGCGKGGGAVIIVVVLIGHCGARLAPQ